MNVLLTGAAGFIGYHVAERLLGRGCQVLGIDSLNSYYDPALKQARLARLQGERCFAFRQVDIADREPMARIFREEKPDVVVHLAAQAGVRYSVHHPHEVADANLVGFLNVLEGARQTSVRHFVYASSSSVYGGNTKVPFSIEDRVDQPISLYAATKRANELIAHCYAHLFSLPATGLRFFTVYGPWGRPDMAPMRFAKAILDGQPIDVFNYGKMRRDFTFIDDIAEGVVRIACGAPSGYRLFNVGNSSPVDLMEFIRLLEDALGTRAKKRFLPMQPGDVRETHADVEDFWRATGFRPATPLETGIQAFARWYREYFGGNEHEHGTHSRAFAVLRAS
ncbi:MAG: NAD-dependent epimerase/dehydratase family protein [Bryobacteraceae bacterium]